MPTEDTAPADALLGRVLSERYRILSKLGEGGMGVVYLAEHVLIEKKVALKVLTPELTRRADLVSRFLQEAKSASRIGHENVIDIADFGQSPEGFVYFAMEYLDGKDLSQVLKESGGVLSWDRAKPILLQVCRALRAAHNRSIIHRDIKPENIFIIDREGRPDFVKVLDFGIAKVMGIDSESQRLTRTGMIFGTPDYMSPEQAQGQKFDHRVDVYAVGCIMHQMLTGEPPFRAESFMGILSKHMFESPMKASSKRPELGILPEVDAIILTALEKDRDRRYPDMTAMAEAIALAGGGTTAEVLTHQRLPTIEFGGASGPIVTGPPTVSARQPGTAGTPAPKTIMPSGPVRLGEAETERVARDEDAPPPSRRAGPRPGTARTAIVVALLAAGAGIAALVALWPEPPPASQPRTTARPTQSPVDPESPAAAPPPVAGQPAPAPAAVEQAAPAPPPARDLRPPGGKKGKKVEKVERAEKPDQRDKVVDEPKGTPQPGVPARKFEVPPELRIPDPLKDQFKNK